MKKDDRILIGTITSPVGLKGEVKVFHHSENRERFETLDRVQIEDKHIEIEKVRYQKHMVVLKFKSIDDRNEAESLRGKNIYMCAEDLEDLDDDSFYVRDLIGLDVIDDNTDETIGVLKDVITERVQPIYIVKIKGEEDLLVPGVSQFIRDIDLEKGVIRMRLLEGMR